MALVLNSTYQNVAYDYVLDGIRDILRAEFAHGKIYVAPVIKGPETFQIKLWLNESETLRYNAQSITREFITQIDLFFIEQNEDEKAYKQLHQDAERIYQLMFNNAHKEVTVNGNALQWIDGTVQNIVINDFTEEEAEIEGLLKATMEFRCVVSAGEL